MIVYYYVGLNSSSVITLFKLALLAVVSQAAYLLLNLTRTYGNHGLKQINLYKRGKKGKQECQAVEFKNKEVESNS